MSGPKDRGGLVRHLFFLLAFVPLLSWNFFTMLPGYWMAKFRSPWPEAPANTSWQETTEVKMNSLQVDFTSYMVVTFMVPTVSVPLLNAVIGHRFRPAPRLLVALATLTILVSLHLAMTMTDTNAWQQEFLILTLVTIFLLASTISVFVSGFTGLAGCFPRAYMISLLRGQSLCAVFTALANLAILAAGSTPETDAFYCFGLTVLFQLVALFAFVMMTRTEFYQHHAARRQPTAPEAAPLLGPPAGARAGLAAVAWGVRVELVTMVLLYATTLACHPGLTVLVEATNLHTPTAGPWEATYFVPTACFLTFTVGNFLGRMVMPHLPTTSSTTNLLLALLRTAALPLFLLCNLVPGQRLHTPVLLPSDLVYVLVMLLFSVSSGILTR